MAYDGEVRISTSIDIGGIKTGVDEIKSEFEKLTPVLDDLTEAIVGIGTKAAKSAPKADFGKGIVDAYKSITGVISAFNSAMSAKENICKLVKIAEESGILATIKSTAATIAYNVANITSEYAVGGLTGAIKALGVAMKANPVGAFIAVITTLTGAVIGLVSWFTRDNEEQKKLKEGAKELKEEYDNLTKSLKESQEAYEDKIGVNAESKTIADGLAASIFKLSEQENKSAEDKAKLAAMVDQLNDSVPELGLAYDATTDSLNMTKDAVNGLIAAEMEELEAQAARERAVEIMKEQAALEQQINEIKNQKTAMEASGADEGWLGIGQSGEYKDLLAAEEDYVNQKKALDDALVESTETMTAAKKKQIEAEKAAYEALSEADKKHVDDYKKATEEQAALMEERAEAEARLTEEMTIQANAQGMTLDEYKEKLEEEAEAEAEINKKREETLQSYTDLATDMFNKLSSESEISVSDMADNLEHNQAVIDAWGDNILALEGVIDEGLLQSLKDAGPESAGAVSALVSATEDELIRLNAAYANGGEAAQKALEASLGVTDGVTAASAELGETTGNGVQAALENADFPGKGGAVVEGVAQGIRDNTPVVVTAATDLGGTTGNSLQTALETADFPGMGKDVAAGFAQGIKDNTQLTVSAAIDMANAVSSAAKVTLEIHSPSQVMAGVGENTVAGFTAGVEKTAPTAISAVETMATGLRDCMIAAEEGIQAELLAMDQRAIAKREAEEEAAYKKAIDDKYQSITDAELKANEEKDKEIERYNKRKAKQKERLDKAEAADRAAIAEEMRVDYEEYQENIARIDDELLRHREDTLADIAQAEEDHAKELYEEAERKHREHLEKQQDALREYRENYESELEAIANKEQSMADRLVGYADLFTRTKSEIEGGDDKFALVDFTSMNKQYDKLISNFSALKEVEIPEQLRTYISEQLQGMNPEEALGFTNEIFSSIEKGTFDEWLAGMQEYLDNVDKYTNMHFDEERAAVEEDYYDLSDLPDYAKNVPGMCEYLGIDAATAFGEGFTEGMGGLGSVFLEALTPLGNLSGDAFKGMYDEAAAVSNEELAKFFSGSAAEISTALSDYIESMNLDPAAFEEAFGLLDTLGGITELDISAMFENKFDPYSYAAEIGEKLETALSTALSAVPTETINAEETGRAVGTELSTGIDTAAPLVEDSMTGVFDGIQGAIETSAPTIYLQYSEFLNTILTMTETFANNMQEKIHTMASNIISTLNSVPETSYAFPDMPPPIVIPRLARGGIVDSATIAMIGEKGREAVVPLSQNAEWMTPFNEMLSEMRAMREEMRQMSGQGDVYIDGRAAGTILAPHVESWQAGRGQKISSGVFRDRY